MARTKTKSTQKIIKQQADVNQWLDMGAFLLSIWWALTVINNARDLIDHSIKNSPNSLALIIASGWIIYSYTKTHTVSRINLVTLTILVTSGIIWLFGLSTYPVVFWD